MIRKDEKIKNIKKFTADANFLIREYIIKCRNFAYKFSFFFIPFKK